MSTRITKSKHLSRDRCALEATTQTGDPNTIEEAFRSPNSEGWKAAMDKELLTLTSHGTMTLVEFPPKGHRPLPTKFVFKTKTNDGVFASFKARLVVGGHRQIENVDFDPNEIFAPVVSIQGARMAMAFACANGFIIRHVDVQSAFVQSTLDEEVYIYLPGDKTKVYKLNKSLYGLKQAGRKWFTHISDVLVNKFDFLASAAEPCIFAKDQSTTSVIIILLIVDDLLILGPESDKLDKLEDGLGKEVKLSSAEAIDWWNGYKVEYDPKAKVLRLSQRAHIERLLERAGMQDCIPTDTPCEPNSKLLPAEPTELLNTSDKEQYMSLLGGAMYIAVHGAPEIQFGVNRLAAFMHAPGIHHMAGLKRVLR